jgi:glycosyltransferase involved in cell wall biosynthesis
MDQALFTDSESDRRIHGIGFQESGGYNPMIPVPTKDDYTLRPPHSTRIKGGLQHTRGEREITEPPNDPSVSIITVVRNGEKHIERAIQSVLDQTYRNIEYIIIDGGSADKTLDIVKKYEGKIAYWVSEPDNGIYDAMNKGLAAATGDWIFFLGSDDVLYDTGTLSSAASFLDKEMSLVFGNIMYHDRRVVKSRFNLFTLLHNTVHHQGAFYNADLFRNWRYDSGLQLIADYELNLRIYLTRMNYRHIDKVISLCNESGQSRANLELAFTETNNVRKKFVRGALGQLMSALYFIKFRISRG